MLVCYGACKRFPLVINENDSYQKKENLFHVPQKMNYYMLKLTNLQNDILLFIEKGLQINDRRSNSVNTNNLEKLLHAHESPIQYIIEVIATRKTLDCAFSNR